MSIVETAKANGLDVYAYLKFLMNSLAKLGDSIIEDDVEPLMPWSDSLPSVSVK